MLANKPSRSSKITDVTFPSVSVCFPAYNEEAIKAEAMHFLDCVEKNQQPLTNGQFGTSHFPVSARESFDWLNRWSLGVICGIYSDR